MRIHILTHTYTQFYEKHTYPHVYPQKSTKNDHLEQKKKCSFAGIYQYTYAFGMFFVDMIVHTENRIKIVLENKDFQETCIHIIRE